MCFLPPMKKNEPYVSLVGSFALEYVSQMVELQTSLYSPSSTAGEISIPRHNGWSVVFWEFGML